jgi:hypoxanthine phosphoribosyltransferase/mannose-6-phosphate isomerase-like protein (cupin superfamily)
MNLEDQPPAGVMRLLRERIADRVAAQLDASVKKYSSPEAVREGCKLLAERIKAAGYVPDVIIGWHDPERTYRGSETIADLLAQELGVEARIANMRESGEAREVIEELDWLTDHSNALIVDDAAYSGRTLTVLRDHCLSVKPTLEIRFAVLSALDPVALPDLFYVSTHRTEELLFPWGWSRLIASFYDLYSLFGILDQRFVTDETEGWGRIATVAEDFTGTVRLLTISPSRVVHHEAERESDTFLYVVEGTAEIRIRNQTGTFLENEYIFIPREIEYNIAAERKVVILQLASRAR